MLHQDLFKDRLGYPHLNPSETLPAADDFGRGGFNVVVGRRYISTDLRCRQKAEVPRQEFAQVPHWTTIYRTGGRAGAPLFLPSKQSLYSPQKGGNRLGTNNNSLFPWCLNRTHGPEQEVWRWVDRPTSESSLGPGIVGRRRRTLEGQFA